MAMLWNCVSYPFWTVRPLLRNAVVLPSFLGSQFCGTSKCLNSGTGKLHDVRNNDKFGVRFGVKFDSKCVDRRLLHQNSDVKDSFAAVLSPKWMVEASPSSVKPYLQLIRLDRPIGTWLVYLPSTWSIAMATAPGHLPDIQLLGLFALGAFLMRGAGCTINDMWDKEYDAKVERTRDRPLACGRLSNFHALVFLGGQLSCALAVLLSLNTYTVLLGASCMVPVVIYPLMKRFMYWPHMFLGITLNWGILLGWSAVQGYCDWPAVLPLYFSGIMLTTVYDLIYAHQDKEDDITAGVKSAALKLGDDSKIWLAGFASAMVGSLTLSGVMCGQSWPFYAGVGVVSGRLAHQLYTVDLNNKDDCGKQFRSNKYLGLFLFAAIAAGTYCKTGKDKHDEEVRDSS